MPKRECQNVRIFYSRFFQSEDSHAIKNIIIPFFLYQEVFQEIMHFKKIKSFYLTIQNT